MILRTNNLNEEGKFNPGDLFLVCFCFVLFLIWSFADTPWLLFTVCLTGRFEPVFCRLIRDSNRIEQTKKALRLNRF